jgi:hypothetical protein
MLSTFREHINSVRNSISASSNYTQHSGGKEPTRFDNVCSSIPSTCFGHQYAHHQEYNYNRFFTFTMSTTHGHMNIKYAQHILEINHTHCTTENRAYTLHKRNKGKHIGSVGKFRIMHPHQQNQHYTNNHTVTKSRFLKQYSHTAKNKTPP